MKTICEGQRTSLVTLKGGLKVTPYHPVRQDGKWHFPCDLGIPEILPCHAVYSFVLDNNHVMIINGVECITLAHGFKDDPVVEHPYFGTDAVLEDLREMLGWEHGLVTLCTGCLQRDSKTGLVSGLRGGRVSAHAVRI